MARREVGMITPNMVHAHIRRLLANRRRAGDSVQGRNACHLRTCDLAALPLLCRPILATVFGNLVFLI